MPDMRCGTCWEERNNILAPKISAISRVIFALTSSLQKVLPSLNVHFTGLFWRAESGGKVDTFQLMLCRWVKHFLFSHKANSAQVVSPGNSGWQFKASAKALGDAAVTAHGVVAEQIHPERPVLELLTDGYDKRIFDFCFVFYTHLFLRLLFMSNQS